MENDYRFIFDAANSIGTLGVLVALVIAFFKGYIVPTSVQTKIDSMRNEIDNNIESIRANYENQLKAMNDARIGDMVDLYNKIVALQKEQIESLKEENRQQELRTERGIQLLTEYIDTQDHVALLADQMRGPNEH